MKTYTQKEITENIEKLSNIIDDLKMQRTSITKSINNTKKQVLYWQELDKSQLKMF